MSFQSTCPHAGRDHKSGINAEKKRRNFNPLAPCGARHRDEMADVKGTPDISIHSPRAGRDIRNIVAILCFNPHTPCGVRLSPYPVSFLSCNFNSLAHYVSETVFTMQ